MPLYNALHMKCMYCSYHILNCHCLDEKPQLKITVNHLSDEDIIDFTQETIPDTQMSQASQPNNTQIEELCDEDDMGETNPVNTQESQFVGSNGCHSDNDDAEEDQGGDQEEDQGGDEGGNDDNNDDNQTHLSEEDPFGNMEDDNQEPEEELPKLPEPTGTKRTCVEICDQNDEEDDPNERPTKFCATNPKDPKEETVGPGTGGDNDEDIDQGGGEDDDGMGGDNDNDNGEGDSGEVIEEPEVINDDLIFHSEHRSGNVAGTAAIDFMTNAVSAHDPDSIPDITASQWRSARWDGVPIDKTLPMAELYKKIFPSSRTMRGLRERFYEVNPFADNKNPTVKEIENWNLEVIRHFRKLLGLSDATHPVRNSRSLFLRAQWSHERKYSNTWDSKYPGTLDSAYGPCLLGTKKHCGVEFIPSRAEDQAPYLYNGEPLVTTSVGTEGVQTINNNGHWSIRMAKIIGVYLKYDGLQNHIGSFLRRSNVGTAWHNADDNQHTYFRVKWDGPNGPPVV